MDVFLIGCILGALFLIYINSNGNNNGNNNGNGGGPHMPSGWIKNGNMMYKIK